MNGLHPLPPDLLESERYRGTRVKIFEFKGVTGKILVTNGLWTGEGIANL
jgi:hypothetical protein